MADHSKPVTASTYANFVTELDARFDDIAIGLDSGIVTATNLPTGAKRWNAAGNKWEKWSGSAWGDLATTYSIHVSSADTLATPRTIDGQSFNGSANITVVAPATHAAASKTTPIDADEIPLADSAATFALKKLTWANLKATIKSYIEGITLSVVNVAAGTDDAPSLQIGSVNDGFYSTSGGVGLSIGGLLHSYVGSTGQVSFPVTNVWPLTTLTSIEAHSQSTTNTVAAAASTYGMLLNYISAPTNLIGVYTNLTSQSTLNGPAGTIAQYRGCYSSNVLGATNLSNITTATNYDTGVTVYAGTIGTGIGYRAIAAIGATSTTSYGFQGLLASGSGKWNLYMSGTAANYLAGNLLIGSAADDGINKLQVTGSASVTGQISGGYASLSVGTLAMALGTNRAVKVTPNATGSLTTTVAPAGATATVLILSSGTVSYTMTFGTGFISTGTLATGTVTAKTFAVSFVSDGTSMIETARTTAM